MEYRAEISRLAAEAEERRRDNEALIHGEPSFFELLKLGLLRQQVYILWAAALSLIHILEIWVLVRFHYAFPPPSGLSALRIISSVSICGLLAAISFRLADFDSEVGLGSESASAARIRRMAESARWILALMAMTAVALALWIAFFSKLQLSSPTAFRAVVFSGVIALPVDVTAAFLLYISGRVGAMPVPRASRFLSLASMLLALVFLAFDLPLFYLLFILFPRFYLLSSAWRNASGERLMSLLRGPRVPLDDRDFFADFKRSFKSFAASQLLSDLGFLFLYAALTRFESGIALLLFLAHKSAHLAVVLLGKTQSSFTAELRAARLIGEIPRLRRLFKNLMLLALVFSLIGYLFSPLFLLQRRTLQWMSPTGEVVAFDAALIAYGLLASTFLVLQVLSLRLIAQSSPRLAVSYAAAFFVFSLGALKICPDFVHFYSFRSALYLLGGLQASFALWTAAAARKAALLCVQAAELSRTGALSLGGLISEMKRDGQAGRLFMLDFKEGSQASNAKRASALMAILDKEDKFCFWGPVIFVLARRASIADFEILGRTLIRNFAGHFSSFAETPVSDAPGAVFEALFRSKDFSAKLYSLWTGRAKAVPAPEDASLAADILAGLRNGRAPGGLLAAVHLGSGFDLSRLDSLEASISARRFLRAVHRAGEFLLPDVGNRREFGGFLHINQGGRPGWILMVPKELRERFAHLRYAVFEHNLLGAMES